MNKQLTYLLALTFLFLFLTGFSFGGFVDDLRFKGTSVGVTKCVERNTQEGVPNSFIKKKCINENQKKLEDNVLGGTSEYFPVYESETIYKNNVQSIDRYKEICINGNIPTNFKLIRKHERGLGTHCVISNWTGKSTYRGTLKNETNDKIITQFEIHIRHEDSPVEKLNFHVWILPVKSYEFEETELVFQPERNRIDKKFYSWSIENVKGVDFILK